MEMGGIFSKIWNYTPPPPTIRFGRVNAFTNMVIVQAGNRDKVQIVFDNYDEKLLKGQTHIDIVNRTAIHYQVTNEIQISHLAMQEFLSSIKTNDELTVFHS